MRNIEQSAGFKKLKAAVDKDVEQFCGGDSRYEQKFEWTIDRAKQYGAALDLDPADILDAWEERRDYWYMNYYQEAKQPKIGDGYVRVFETVEDLKTSIGGPRFRCPNCKGISSDAHVCDSGLERDGKVCDWKSYGLFGTLGLGAFAYVKEKLTGQSFFMPVAWESAALKKGGEG